MRPRALIIVVVSALTLLSPAQRARAKPTEQKRAPIKDRFAGDWLVAGNDTLVYSRSFNRRHEFGYVTCSSAERICRVNVIRADSSDHRARSCGLRYDLIQGRTGDMALYLPDRGADIDSEQVAQAWWLKAEDASDTRITALRLRGCMNAGFDITPVAGHPSRSRVVAYGYPSFDLVYSDAFREPHEKRVRFVTFAGGKQRERAWSLQADRKFMYEERGVEDSSSRGFFYLSTDGEPDWRVRAMYANSSSAELKKLGVVDEHLRDPTRTYPKSSGAHRRYGLCWRNLDRDDARVNCTQFKTDGRRSIGRVSLNLEDRVDWLAVHNLEEPAMLLVSGKCDEGKCGEFSVRKIHASGRTDFLARVDDLDAECPTAPFDLTMDVVEEVDAICFNFVCLSTRYKESTAEKANTTLRYRRHCLDGDYFAKKTVA